MTGLLGVSAMAEALTRDPTQMRLVKERGQVIFFFFVTIVVVFVATFTWPGDLLLDRRG